MIKIEPGSFLRKMDSPATDNQTVALTRTFYLSDREISVGQYEQFHRDLDYMNDATTLKTMERKEADRQVSPTPDHPTQCVSWYDAALFF